MKAESSYDWVLLAGLAPVFVGALLGVLFLIRQLPNPGTRFGAYAQVFGGAVFFVLNVIRKAGFFNWAELVILVSIFLLLFNVIAIQYKHTKMIAELRRLLAEKANDPAPPVNVSAVAPSSPAEGRHSVDHADRMSALLSPPH